ncbi:12435_t:CDS:2, partial [Ambispora leptoticha]
APYDKTTNDILSNLDCPDYLVEKYNLTPEQIQECYQALADNLANNPNVIRQVAEMVARLRSHLAEGIGRPITNEEIKPVTEAISKLTITLLIEKNIDRLKELGLTRKKIADFERKLTGETLKTFLDYISKNNTLTQQEMADYASQLVGQPITRYYKRKPEKNSMKVVSEGDKEK